MPSTDNALTLDKSKDQSFTIKLTIDKTEIAHELNHQLTHLQKHFNYKGFRQGSVPLNIIRDNVDLDQVLAEVASTLISQKYPQIIKDKQLKPIITPKVSISNPPLKLDQDWQVVIQSSELPLIKLNQSYIPKIKKLKTKDIDSIFSIILKLSQVDLPPIVIDSELENRLSHFVDDLRQVNLSPDQYFKSKNLTPENFRQSLMADINREWKLNLAINHIAKEHHLEVKKDELDKILKEKPQLSAQPQLAHYLQLQQKVIDFLQKL